MDSSQMPFVLLFLFLSVVLAYAYLQSEGRQDAIPEPAQLKCSEGETRACQVHVCTGVQQCVNGKWGNCEWEIICSPGAYAPCSPDMCGTIYMVCNDCGSGYETCISGREG